MKAIHFEQSGPPDVLMLADLPAPQPQADELLVRVRAAALNRADLLQRMGGYAPPPGASPILGLELSGEVTEAAGDFQVGDRVMAVVTGGAYAELAVVPVGMAMRVPGDFTDEQAAAIPEAFLTAYLNLFTMGGLTTGESVLIHAGASGIGTAAIQLARAAGARVFASAGTDAKCRFCESLGAEAAFNYKTVRFRGAVLDHVDDGLDLILDFVGAPNWDDNLASLAWRGRLMLIGFLGGSKGQLDLAPVMVKNLRVTGTTLRRTPLDEKIALTRAFVDFAMLRFASGELRPIIDRVFPLAQAADAHRFMQTNANIGKIILTVP